VTRARCRSTRSSTSRFRSWRPSRPRTTKASFHRDLKPPNIFLARTRDGAIQPKVLDFGISKAPACSPIRTSGAMLGSPSYFAPEQVQDPKAVSPASDQYALGVILLRMRDRADCRTKGRTWRRSFRRS
jgi:serine/threonine-protein kinase